MNSNSLSRNLRRLRQNQNLTQEQLAVTLGVSTQSVSRWECGNTLPDVMLLPEIARVYGVMVDDLFREEAMAYPSYAQRLLAVYEESGRTEDFLAAEQEFERMSGNKMTADDLRAWGVLYHYMMQHCAQKAQRKLEQAMSHPDAAENVQNSAAQQKIALLCDLGRGGEEATRCDRELSEHKSDPRRWLLCTAAHHMAGNQKRALEVAREGMARFPDQPALHVYAGDICMALKQYSEALSHWQNALDMEPELYDAAYSMGFCYEELGDYGKAWTVWENLANALRRRGMSIEAKFPEQQAQKCRKRMG